MTRSILLVGAGGHARACIDVIERQGEFTIAGLLGTRAEVGTVVLGYRVLGTDEDLPGMRAVADCAIVAIGQIKTPEPRQRAFDLLERGGWESPVIVSPLGHVSRHARVGDGTIVMHGAIVNAAASVGRNCIINSRALVEHDVAVSDHCHIATGALINSGVRVGRGSFVGSGSSVRQGVTIGDMCVIGMGQRVLNDCPSGSQVPPGRTA